jgi:hypothetical protein
MYLGRLRADTLAGRRYLSLLEGVHDAAHRWVVTHSLEDWREEMPWMLFYFSTAVWLNLALVRAPAFHADDAGAGSDPIPGPAAPAP